MTRGPRGLRREVHHARSSSPLPPTGLLSECLREAGAEVVAKSSGGALQRTDISRPGLAGEILTGPSELDVLRGELEEKTRSLKSLQRNYENLSSLSARDREDLASFRRAHEDHEREVHGLRKDNDALTRELSTLRGQQANAVGDRDHLEKRMIERTESADKKIAELQAAWKDARAQVQNLQESLRAERATSKTTTAQLQEERAALEKAKLELAKGSTAAEERQQCLNESKARLKKLEAQCAEYKTASSKVEGQLQALRKDRESIESELGTARSKCKLADENIRKQQLELEGHRSEVKRLSDLLEKALADAESSRICSASQLDRELARLAEEKREEMERIKGFDRAAEARLNEALVTSEKQLASATCEQTKLKAALEKAEREHTCAREEIKELKQSRHHLDATVQGLRSMSESLCAERDKLQKAISDANDRLGAAACEHEAIYAARAAEAVSARAELLAERESSKAAAVSAQEALLAEQALVRESEVRRRQAEKTVDSHTNVVEELRQKVMEQEGLFSQSAQLAAELKAVKGELVAVRRQADDAKSEAKRWGDKVGHSEAEHGASIARLKRSEGDLELLRSELQESQANNAQLSTERDILQKVVSDANERLATAARENDVSCAEAASVQAELAAEREKKMAEAASAQAELATELESKKLAAATAQEALLAEQKLLRASEARRFQAEERAASCTTATDELRKQVEEQERRLVQNAQIASELEAVRRELASVQREAADAKREAKRWGDKVGHAEAEQGASIARLKRAEAALELMRSELQEAQADNSQLQADVELMEKRLQVKNR